MSSPKPGRTCCDAVTRSLRTGVVNGQSCLMNESCCLICRAYDGKQPPFPRIDRLTLGHSKRRHVKVREGISTSFRKGLVAADEGNSAMRRVRHVDFACSPIVHALIRRHSPLRLQQSIGPDPAHHPTAHPDMTQHSQIRFWSRTPAHALCDPISLVI